MVTVMNAEGQPIQLPAATLQAAKAQNGIGNILLPAITKLQILAAAYFISLEITQNLLSISR